jgi:hypothetical protein
MVITLAALLVCLSMLLIYVLVRTEERHLEHRKQEIPPPSEQGSKNN